MDEKKVIVTVYLGNGQSWASSPLKLDATQHAELIEMVEDLSTLDSFRIPVIDGLNRKSTMYFNPKHVSAIQLVEA